MQRRVRFCLWGGLGVLVTAGALRAGVPMSVNDGSFELGPPPNSAWTEEGTTTEVCEWIVDNTTLNSVFDFATNAHTGSWVYWAGGYCPVPNASIDSVSQNVTVPVGVTGLSFWYQVRRGDPDDEGLDVAYVSINDAQEWTVAISQANDIGPTWRNAVINVAAFSGSTVDLTVGNFAVGATGNCLFDTFEWMGAVPIDERSWGEIKNVFR